MNASYTAFNNYNGFCPRKKMFMPLKTSEPSGTSKSNCTRTFQKLTEYLHRNPPEPHRLSAPEPSGTSPGICIGTFQNLTMYLLRNPLHRNLQNLKPPEPHQVSAPEPSGTSTGVCTGTLRSLARNLDRTRANLG